MKIGLSFIAAAAGALIALPSGCRPPPAAAVRTQPPSAAVGLEEERRSAERAQATAEQRAEAHARYAVGLTYDFNDQRDLATEEFFKSAMADPSNESLAIDVARRFLQSKEPEKAIELLQRGASRTNSSGNLLAWLGIAQAQAGKNDAAIESHRKAISRFPPTPLSYHKLVELLLEKNELEPAVQVLDQGTNLAGLQPSDLIHFAELYTRLARLSTNRAPALKAQGLHLFEQVAKTAPSSPLLLIKLADGFNMLGEDKKAAEIYQRLLQRFPTLPTLREKLADLYLRGQDKPRAREQLEAMRKENPTNPQIYYFLASLANEEQNFDEAAENYNKAMMLNPDFEQAYYDFAGMQINHNKPKEALVTLEMARTKFPKSFIVEFFTGLAYSRLKNYSNSVQHFTAAEVIARATEPRRLTQFFYFQAGAAAERNQDHAQAEKHFEKCLEIAPDFAEALNYLGYMWAEQGVKLDRAREFIEKAVKLEPENSAYLDSLAWVLFKLKQPQAALPHLLKAIQASEEPDPTLFDHLGDIYSALNEKEKAREAWRKALQLDPTSSIQKKLEPVSPGNKSPIP